LSREPLRDCLADAAGRARHDRDLAVESLLVHVTSLIKTSFGCRALSSRHCEAPRADTGQESTISFPRWTQTWSCRLKVVRICPGMKSTWLPSAGGAPIMVTVACSSLNA